MNRAPTCCRRSLAAADSQDDSAGRMHFVRVNHSVGFSLATNVSRPQTTETLPRAEVALHDFAPGTVY